MSKKKSATADKGSSQEESDGSVAEESVCVEFCAAIDCQSLKNSNHTNSLKFFGLDTDRVILQMNGNTFFGGQFERVFGTDVLFEVKDSPKRRGDASHADSRPTAEASQESHKSLHYIGKCDQKLVMKRVFLESVDRQSMDTTEHTNH